MQVNKKSSVGRKPIDDKKVTINLFIRQSVVDHFGGKEQVQKIAYDALSVNVLSTE